MSRPRPKIKCRCGVGALALGAIAGLLGGCDPPSRAKQPAVSAAVSQPWFVDESAKAGLSWSLGHGKKSPLDILEVMGTGCAVLDVDGDGWDDLFLIGQKGTGSTGRCALYRNQGNGTFADISSGSGVEPPGLYMGCAVADYDNDGRPDLFVTGFGVNRLFRNRGGGKFEDRTAATGLAARSPTDWSTAAAFGDYDGDGHVDLYMGRYIHFPPTARRLCDFKGVPGSCPPSQYQPQFGSLYRNRGNGTFMDVTRIAGLGDQHGRTLGAVFADVNDDGRPDLYLGNDLEPGDLYENLGKGRFRNRGTVSGTAVQASGQVQSAMGVDFADYDGDQRPDLIVTTFQDEPDSLYRNQGDGFFEHATRAAGLEAATRKPLGFGVRLADYDNDGRPDLAIANGHVVDRQEQVEAGTAYRQPLQLFQNPEGRGFVDRSAEAGEGFTRPAVGRGLATGDFDRDGRLDLIAIDLEGPARLLMNRRETGNAWVGLRLEGAKGNRMALGARVRVTSGGRTRQAEVNTGGSYLSGSSPALVFGLGAEKSPVKVEIRWPEGRHTTLTDVPLNQYHAVHETRGRLSENRP